jgi:hypothetical protein
MEQKLIDPDLHGIETTDGTRKTEGWLDGFWDGSRVWRERAEAAQRNFELSIWVAASGWMLATGALIALALNRFPL